MFSVAAPLQSPPTSGSSPTFSYRIGASFSAKGRRFDPKKDVFTFNPKTQITSDHEIFTGRPNSGQDAFFVSGAGNSNNVAFGVADGVGGWADQGIDSAHFSHGLCRKMATVARDLHLPDMKDLRPQSILGTAYQEIIQEGKIKGGGSTVCLATGHEEGNVKVANLGDSGFIHFRLNAVHHFSNPQTHAFNTPYQLSVVPPRILALSQLFGGKQLHDSPEDSNDSSHVVRHGDVLIFATDGIWDNLSTQDMLKIVSGQMTGFHAWETGGKGTIVSERIHDLTREGGISKQYENTLQTLLAVNVIGEAKAASMNSQRDGPFAKEIQKFYPHEDFYGGKVDDLCVIVAIVVQDQ
ncbi:5-azacytidine resistance protein azr1 [Usnea florida]